MQIQVKRWQPEDAAALAALFGGVDRGFLSDRLPNPYTRQDADFWLHRVQEREGHSGVYRAIWAGDQLVGMVSVDQKEDVCRKDAEISYLLLTGQWSRGIMTEAVGQTCVAAFQELDILRITGQVYDANLASRRVLEKNGFMLEGVMKNAVFKNGRLYDLCIYGKQKEQGS